MSDNTPKESAEEAKGIPQSVVDEVAALAADVTAMKNRAARGWKVTAVVWVILLSVIAGYLYILVYKPLNDLLEPESVVQLGITTLNGALAGAGVPAIDSPELAPWAAGKLKDAAPTVMREQVKPQLEQLTARLPELREKYTARIRREAPVWINEAVDEIGDKWLPKAELALLKFVDEKTDELMAELGTQVDAVVGQVITSTERDLRVFTEEGGDVAALRARLEEAFEQAMGPVLDELLDDIDVKVRDAGRGISELVAKHKAKRLTPDEVLEVRLIQLTIALFGGAAEDIPTGGGMLEELRSLLEQAGLPVARREAVVRDVAGTGRIGSMEDVLKDVPEDRREEFRKALEAIVVPIEPGR